MNINKKNLWLPSLFSLLFAIPHAYGMEEEKFPKNTKVCCLASLAVYGDEHDGGKNARVTLENKNYICKERYENPSVALRMELWQHLNGQSIIAIRGTIPTKENLLSDAAIIKYGLDNPEPYTYLTEFSTTIATKWFNNNLITNPYEDLRSALPSSTTVYDMVHKIGSTITGVTGGGIGALTLTVGSGVAVAGLLTYAAYKLGESYHPETIAINTLVATSQHALKKTNEWMKKSVDNGEELPLITGHSLGGLIVNTVAELSENVPQQVITLNAPGGAGRFITAKKKYIMGEQDDSWTWVKKTVVRTEEEFHHNFRGLTHNIARENEMISCFGEDKISRKSILIPDYRDEKCPMSIRDYPMENHAIYNLAKDLGAL